VDLLENLISGKTPGWGNNIRENSRLGKGNIRENSRLGKGNIHKLQAAEREYPGKLPTWNRYIKGITNILRYSRLGRGKYPGKLQSTNRNIDNHERSWKIS